MFERYTESARRVLFFARYEVTSIGGDQIEPTHILLGLLRSHDALLSHLFAQAHLTYKDVRREIAGRNSASAKHETSVELPFDSRTKKVLAFAAEEADRLAHSSIGAEHLLLGLLREEGPGAESPTQARGMRVARVRDEIVRLLREQEDGQRALLPSRSPEFADMPAAVSPGVFDGYRARQAAERGARLEELLAQLEPEVAGNPRALEILAAMWIEVRSLKSEP
jgi:ATP-dependent Clp protease ATP-binding subunit ClpC